MDCDFGYSDALSIGIGVDVLLSVVLADLAPETARAVLQTLTDLGLPLWHDSLLEKRPSLPSRLPLLRDLGRVENRMVNSNALIAALQTLRPSSDS